MAQRLDATGLKCPLPVLRARKAIKALDPGQELLVLATDPAAVEDFRAFCEAASHAFLDAAEDGGVFRIAIRKGG
ncbi:MAG: sulfurtransferase TusA family protein [Defluviicoccus sp.]|nr:sulfurtransferase TusA family protein [Defluviicoccus sp.]MDE0383444.1 sulfurtransferase TusA family protein [Defluviicoccus sp.]